MSSLAWYWHRLTAMTPAELGGHLRRKACQFSDACFSKGRFAGVADIPAGATFPCLPPREGAPEVFLQALRQDTADILAGQWIAFGYLPLKVDPQLRWHKDYLAGADLATTQRSFKLHHRLEGQADIKLMWEPSRWYSLVRLAQAAYLLNDSRAAAACRQHLAHWAKENPAFFGWNWTSGLESGLRLVQLTWIDALLAASPPAGRSTTDLGFGSIRAALLPPHLWFTWRDRSFGSSANNHLIGELTGLILAVVRWPELARWAVPLSTLQPLWEKQVLTQFAPDGGNCEQALNYHLFSWEFCWQTRLALLAAGRSISPEVEDRLRTAATFFRAIQSETDRWDYGDSDSAFVTPLFANWPEATAEWLAWMKRPDASPSVHYWMGAPPKELTSPAVVTAPPHWQYFPDSGYAVCHAGDWFLRWDLSPLGYLATASHGHCDALHLSIWFRGKALIIDPGTGAYHAHKALRTFLASWDAHNGPHPEHLNFPQRRGAFLWSEQHAKPRWETGPDSSVRAELQLPQGMMRRTISPVGKGDGWQIEDAFQFADPAQIRPVVVHWQFAPATPLHGMGGSTFRMDLESRPLTLQFSSSWTTVTPIVPSSDRAPDGNDVPQGICSPAFRKTLLAPRILLRAENPGVAPLLTTISA